LPLPSPMQRSEAATPRHAAATENQRAQKARQTSTPLSPLLRFVFPSPLRCRSRFRAAPLRRPLPPGSATASRSPARALLSSRALLASTGQRHPPPSSRSARPRQPPPRRPLRSAGAPPPPRPRPATAAPAPQLLAGGDPPPGAPRRAVSR